MQSINTHSIEDYLANNSLFPIVCNFKSIYENFYESNGFLTAYAFDSLNNWTCASSSLIKSLYFRTFSLCQMLRLHVCAWWIGPRIFSHNIWCNDHFEAEYLSHLFAYISHGRCGSHAHPIARSPPMILFEPSGDGKCTVILIDSRGTLEPVNKLITPPSIVYTRRLQMAPIMIDATNTW